MSRQQGKPPARAGAEAGKGSASTDMAPGKRTRSERLRMPEPVQRRPAAPAPGAGVPVRPVHTWLHDPLILAAHGIGTAPEPAHPVQARGVLAHDAGVHEAAARGVAGGGGALPHLDIIQASFGAHDVSRVEAHLGGAAADACATMGASAYATGHHVAFAGAPDLRTAAHEAAHVVQQRGGVQLAGGVGRSGDGYEQHADAVADAVVAGRSAESLLDRMAGPAPASARGHAVQRFESHEHKVLGDEGTRTAGGDIRHVEVAPGYFLSFGDLTAMAGDFFGSVAELARLAARPGTGAGTREEVEYVRVVKVAGATEHEGRFSQAARDAVDERYYRLAGSNSAHFTRPRGLDERSALNNAGNYRDNHENAIREAVRAGVEGRPLDRALLYEGFASHFLTDAYAAGHVRTERIGISEWWNPRVPMFWTNLRLFIAEQMAWHINDNTRLAGYTQSVHDLWLQVRGIIEEKNLPTLTFGDLISGAVHDYDNDKGVVTQHGRLLGDTRLRDSRGEIVPGPGGERRIAGADHTENTAIVAVRLSFSDIERAYELGRSQSPDQVVETLRNDGLYAAERIWPQAFPDARQPVPRPRWQHPDTASLLADETMQEAITIFASEKAESLEGAIAFEDVRKLGMVVVVTAALQAQGFRQRVTEPLRTDPIGTLRRIIDYTPNVGGGKSGLAADNIAMSYIQMARQQNALPTLTQPQRTRLIRELVRGYCAGDEERAIIELLQTCSPGMMTAIVKELGHGNARKGIDFLDSGVDFKEWSDLKQVLRRSDELKGLL